MKPSIDGDRYGDVEILHDLLPLFVFTRPCDIEDRMPDQKCVENEIHERYDVDIERVVSDLPAKQGHQPAYLTVDPQQAQTGIDKHPFDLVQTENGHVENSVDENREATVYIKKCHRGMFVGIGYEKARSAKRQHMKKEERVDQVPGDIRPLGIEFAVYRDVAVELHSTWKQTPHLSVRHIS